MAGIPIGVTASFTGLGGGPMIVPLLLALKFDAQKAVGTAFISILLVSLSSFVAHAAHQQVDYLTGALLGIGGLVGGQIGPRLLQRVSTVNYKRIFATVLVGLAVYLVVRALLVTSARAIAGGEPIGVDWSPLDMAALVIGGVGIGIAASFVGLGGGFLIVPILLTLGYSHPLAVGTTFLAVVIVAASAVVAHSRHRVLDRPIGVALGVGGIIGAQAGPWLNTMISTFVFHFVFAAMLVWMACYLVAMSKLGPTPATSVPPPSPNGSGL